MQSLLTKWVGAIMRVRGGLFGAGGLVCLLLSGTSFAEEEVRTHTEDRTTLQATNTLAQVVDTFFQCDHIEPMFGLVAHSPARPGTILKGIPTRRFDGKFVGYNLLKSDDSCTPTLPLPASLPGGKRLVYNYKTEADANLALEIAKIFNGLSFNAEYLKQVSITISDFSYSWIDGGDVRSAVQNVMTRPNCAGLKSAAPLREAYAAANAVVVNMACVGKVSVKFDFNRAVRLSLMKNQIGNINVGLGLNFKQTNLNEVPCPALPQQATPAKQEEAKKKAEAQEKKEEAAAKAALTEAAKQLVEYLKKLLAEAEKKNSPDVPAIKKEVAKAQDEVKKASASAPEPKKCYEGFVLETGDPVVFGVTWKPAAQYFKK
jgi:hypothetical protein